MADKCYNTSGTNYEFHKNDGEIVRTALSFLVLLVNFIEIVYIVRLRERKSNYETLLLSLSIADLCFAIANITVSIFLFEDLLASSGIGRMIYIYSLLLSVLHILGITVDRMFAILLPLKHRIYWRRRQVLILIFFLWVVPLLIIVPLFSTVYIYGFTYFAWMIQHLAMYLIFISNCLFTIAYIVIFVKLRQQFQKQKFMTFRKEDRVQCTISAKEIRVFVLCFLTCVTYIALTLPFAIYLTFRKAWPTFCGILLVLNSGINSCIYLVFGSSFCKRCCKKNSAESRSTRYTEQKLS